MKNPAALLLIIAGLVVLILPSDALTKPRVIHVEWHYQYDGNVGGYRLYQDGNRICETNDPDATAMDCSVSLPDGEFFFTLTAYFQDGTESPHSAPFAGIFSSKLLASISAQPLDGDSPLAVFFDASPSAGTIISYDWTFGDGDIGAGEIITHTYYSDGNYTAILKITDDTGAVDRETVPILVTSSIAANMPPMAVISSSLSVGEAPLPVQFDGSGSTDSDGTILAYQWDMGDGNTGTGALTENNYITAGTFHAALTVTDNGGLTDSGSTPVLVTDPLDSVNVPPTADFSASPDSGNAPLAVTLDAGQSADPDGQINNYSWIFGDGSTGAGVLVNHNYLQSGEYTTRLKVTDNQGAWAETSTMITAQTGFPESSVAMELGSVTVNNTWRRVDLTKDFINPVVIVGPPGSNDNDPCIVRIRNVNTTGFDIRIQEWDYLDDFHADETVHYFVIEQGLHTLSNGARIEAGAFIGGIRFQALNFQRPFPAEPVVLTTVSSVNEEDAVTGRIRKLSPDGFEYKLSEQEANKFSHADEIIGYVAWESGTGSIDQVEYEAGKTDNSVAGQWQILTFQKEFPEIPLFFAAMQTYNSGENAAVRYQYLTTADVFVKIEEEASKDSETEHTSEQVGYINFSTVTTK
jgi:PKD repeat protein